MRARCLSDDGVNVTLVDEIASLRGLRFEDRAYQSDDVKK